MKLDELGAQLQHLAYRITDQLEHEEHALAGTMQWLSNMLEEVGMPGPAFEEAKPHGLPAAAPCNECGTDTTITEVTCGACTTARRLQQDVPSIINKLKNENKKLEADALVYLEYQKKLEKEVQQLRREVRVQLGVQDAYAFFHKVQEDVYGHGRTFGELEEELESVNRLSDEADKLRRALEAKPQPHTPEEHS